jgi:hypothetical protein
MASASVFGSGVMSIPNTPKVVGSSPAAVVIVLLRTLIFLTVYRMDVSSSWSVLYVWFFLSIDKSLFVRLTLSRHR